MYFRTVPSGGNLISSNCSWKDSRGTPSPGRAIVFGVGRKIAFRNAATSENCMVCKHQSSASNALTALVQGIDLVFTNKKVV